MGAAAGAGMARTKPDEGIGAPALYGRGRYRRAARVRAGGTRRADLAAGLRRIARGAGAEAAGAGTR